jgi:hypothetical protein
MDSGPFPRAIQCHACGQQFIVLDNGERLSDADTAATDFAPALLPTPVNSFFADDHAAGFVEPISSAEQLLQLDVDWQREYERHSIAIFHPTRALGLSIAIGVGGTFLAMMVVEAVGFKHYGNPVLIVGAFLGLAGGYCLYVRGSRFEAAEKRWIQSQLDVYRNHQRTPPASLGESAMRWTWLRTLIGSLLLAGMIVGILIVFCGNRALWVGHRDLKITFIVRDADTGEPVPAAAIEILLADGNFCQNCAPPIKLITDKDGVARRACEKCMCTGSSGWVPFFRWRETFSSHTPGWGFTGSSPAHEKSELHWLDEGNFRRTIQRGDVMATMQVEIKLRRIAALKK